MTGRSTSTWLPTPGPIPVTLLGSTFTRREAISAVARAFDVTPDQALVLTSQLLNRDSVVRVLADPEAGPESIRTRSGHVVSATSGDRRYTTTELLAAEQRIIGSATARVGEGTGQVAPGIVDHVLARHPHLDGEQANGVRALLTSGNGYDLVIGQAGTGKSTLLGAARAGWEEAGYKVIGTAVAARTAADLEAGTGIPSSSLTQLLADLREGGGLTSRHVIVVDEASLVGSRPLDRLRSHVDGAGAKLVLTGDNRQLSSIDAGGALRSLLERTRRPRRHPHHQPPPGRLRPAMGTRRPRRSPRRRRRRGCSRLHRAWPSHDLWHHRRGPASAGGGLVGRPPRPHHRHPGRSPGRRRRPE